MITVVTGLFAGAIHVWSGADHLAAVAPLAVRKPHRAWRGGVRWALGHSAGVALVGLASLALRDLLPVDLISSWGERLVGIVLCGIGIWGLRRALKNQLHTHEHEHDGERHVHLHVHTHGGSHDRSEAHRHRHAAFGIGVLHGLAGSSHLLGVLPILAFPSAAQAVAYLLAFTIGTVLSMGLFSAVLGAIATRCSLGSAQAYKGLMSFCSLSAIAVGCFWLLAGFR